MRIHFPLRNLQFDSMCPISLQTGFRGAEKCFAREHKWKLLSASLCCHSPSEVSFKTHTNEKEFEQSRWLTIAGCLLLRARLALGKAGERPPRPPLCTEDSRLCMSEWAPSKPGTWPTAWLRNTWMASSKRSSNLLCYINTRGMHLQLNMTNLI